MDDVHVKELDFSTVIMYVRMSFGVQTSSDLVEATFGQDLQQLVGLLGLVAGNDARRLCCQRLAAHQHHYVYCFLEEDNL